MCRSVWWAFAAAGSIALVAAVAAALQPVSAPAFTGAWQLAAGVLLLLASVRSPGGIPKAMPFFGTAAAGVVLGIVGVLLPAPDSQIGLVAIGIWSLLAGAGYLAISRIARAFRVRDGGLMVIAWAGVATGIAVSTMAVFKLGSSTLAVPAALAITGAVTIAAATRLRELPDEAPPILSNRELRRRGGNPERGR
jgi:hypothetical protein